jgi:hypothetical protein
MTVMIGKFFGAHQILVRTGILCDMKEGEIRLYLVLMERSEWFQSRLLTLTDKQVCDLGGAASRTLCNARKKLQEKGLIRYKAGAGNKYTYTICDPETREPYPGDPKTPIVMPKRSRTSHPPTQVLRQPLRRETESSRDLSAERVTAPVRKLEDEKPLEAYGLPGVFDARE